MGWKPQRSLLTTYKRNVFFAALKAGQRRSQAAILAGIAPVRITEWMARGEGRDPDRPATPLYQEFVRDVYRAEAEVETKALEAVTKGFARDPRLAWQWLENRSPEWRQWRQPAPAPGTAVQIGAPGGTTQVLVISAEDIRRYGAQKVGELSAPTPDQRARLVEDTGPAD